MNRATRSCELLKLRRLALRGMGELNRQGERPCVITSLDAGNPAKLANRGIVRLERVELVAGHAYNAVSDPAFEHKGE